MTCMATTQPHPAYGSVLLAVAIEPEEIGAKIKAARKRRHWTQLDFALEAHVSPSSVARWEAGGLPPVRELIRIADVLEIPTETLVEPEPELEDKYELILGAIREQAQAEKQHHEQENQHNEQLEKRLRAIEAAFRTRRSRKAKRDEPTR